MAHVLDPIPSSVSGRNEALALVVKVVALSAAGIVAGGTFAVWRGYPPQGLSPGTFVEMQQDAIRGMNVLFPVVGAVAILATLILALMERGGRRAWLLAAVGLFVVAALVTRFGNQPINAVVMGWSPDAPPPGWEALRDRWWTLHLIRTAVTCLGYLALLLGCLMPSTRRPPSV
ncbi:hypothetical protein Rumeso_03856 [Rubellimicrobium mesophilum DSM 19309]|uniref:DUF1772 domain-containing protein n=1 Tax=Rubellimicrobium mesophilum DSM 19309 TaxID=442562 RepID=A0A017HJT1_9RHOB|nr:DUF1772 domain-containing protein [Rubellimicrobium mesophilum]EYD74560.1 hypothetical protein Rumeso_03856 [Rubellimicrobium mesophilum DSM 19309]